MESILFLAKIPYSENIRPQFTRQQLCRGRMFEDPTVRPPILDEMMEDIERVIASVAQKYCDTTTPHLAFDELVSEGRLKLAELITKGELNRQYNRVNFFKFFATAVNNQARSRVQKYRFTEKRTGVKPPPREDRFKKPEGASVDHEDDEHLPTPEYHKNVELSLDDPNNHLQVQHQSIEDEADTRQLEEEYEAILDDVEILVFRQLHKPNAKTCAYALEDAYRKEVGKPLRVTIRSEHRARGIGMDVRDFENVVLTVRRKILAYRNMTEDQQDKASRRNALIATLSQIFNVQIPPGLDDMVVRRLFTMAAIDQYDEKVKSSPDVAEMLVEIGAKPPRMIGNRMACYGVLYQKNCRKCNTCDLRHSCAVEASNVGLSKISISPKLLGSRGQRIPAFLPRMGTADSRISTADEAEILAHLDETFEKVERDGSVTYYHVVGQSRKKRNLFSIEQASPLRLRFWNPSEALRKKLVGKQKAWRAPEDAALHEIIELIEQHAKETFE